MKRVITVLLSLFLLFGFSGVFAAEYIVSTGSETGNYYAVGQSIKRIVDEKGGLFNIEVSKSEGSVENLCRLIDGKSDFAIMQSNVLYEYVKGLTDFKCKHGDTESLEIVGIASLYPEYTQILVRKDSGIRNVSQLINKNVFLGEDGSGSRASAETILEALDIKKEDINSVSVDRTSEALDRLLCGDCEGEVVDAVFVTTGEFKLRLKKYNDSLTVISFSQHESNRIKKKYPYFWFETVRDMHRNDYVVPYTRALLVKQVKNKASLLMPDVVSNVVKGISENLANEVSREGKNIDVFREKMMAREMPVPFHEGADLYYKEHGYIQDNADIIYLFLTCIFITAISFVSYVGVNWKWVALIREKLHVRNISTNQYVHGPWNKLVNNWLAFSFWALITFMLFIIIVMLETEEGYAKQFDAVNLFGKMDLLDLLTWMIVFMMSGYTQDAFPNAPLGKAVAVAIPLLFYIVALMTIFRANLRINKNAEKRESGLLVPHLKQHVVICGWNDRVPEMIREITCTNSIKKGIKVVVIADLADDKPFTSYDFPPGFVHYCKGISSDYLMLRKACINDARKILIVADDQKITRNNIRGVLTAYAIRMDQENNSDVIAELFYEENKDAFINAGVGKLVPINRLYERLISSATFNPGLSDIVTGMLSFDGVQIVKSVALNDDHNISDLVVGKTFHAANTELRKRNMMLVAIYSDQRKPVNGHASYEMHFLENSPYIINPGNELDLAYQISKKDKLIVIQYNKAGIKGERLGEGIVKNGKSAVFKSGEENLLVIGRPEDTSNYVSILESQGVSYELLPIDANKDLFEVQKDIDKIITNDKSRYSKVSRAIIFSPMSSSGKTEGSVYQDDFVMSISLTIKNIYKALGEDIYIVSEMRSSKNRSLYYELGVAQPIPVNQLIELMQTRMVFYDGVVSGLFIKLMDYSEKNLKSRLEKLSISSLPVETQEVLLDHSRNLSFDDIANELVKINVQLFALAVNGAEIFINPSFQEAKVFELTAQDCLFVIADVKNSIQPTG